MFLRVNLVNIVIAEKQRRICRLFKCSAEYDFLSLLATIWTESHFPLKGLILIFFRSLFNSIADVFMSYTTKNREILSANSLTLGISYLVNH